MPLLYLLAPAEILTLLMLVDCALNRRQLTWFFILILLGPLGGPVYLIYHYRSVTFPFRIAHSIDSMGTRPGSRKCPRCLRLVDRLDAFEDGRSTIYICNMCRAEMELLRTKSLRF